MGDTFEINKSFHNNPKYIRNACSTNKKAISGVVKAVIKVALIFKTVLRSRENGF